MSFGIFFLPYFALAKKYWNNQKLENLHISFAFYIGTVLLGQVEKIFC